MKKLLFSLFLIMQVVSSWAQQLTTVRGTVINSTTQKPLQNVTVTLQSTNQTVITDAEGHFVLENVAEGEQFIFVTSTGYTSQTYPLQIAKGETVDMGIIQLTEDITSEQQLSIITLTDNDLSDDNSGSENTAGLLQASRDPFQQAAAFNWGMARYMIRGLDNEYGVTMINGVPMNKLYDGRPQWSNWGGLNDATRNQEFTTGSRPSDYTFGSVLGTQEINTRASAFRPGGRLSFSGTNTNYNWRAMATYASGMDENGFSYVISASRRWAVEGYFDGTDYSANSLFASVEKRFGSNHSLNFTSIYAQNTRGKNSPNTEEVNSLMDEKYNSYWGWQNGKKRNSRDKDVEEPILMLSHFWQMDENTSLNTNVAYQFGKIGNSRLDFQDANNPDPTYYRNLPSFYTSQYDNASLSDLTVLQPGGVGGDYIGDSPQNQLLAEQTRDRFLANPQINWDAMYRANTIAVTDENNIETGRVPGVSKYVLYEDRTDDKTLTVNTIFNSQLSDNITLNAGALFRKLKSHNFQYLLDLLGGSYYNDIDPFYAGNASQSDLNNPNRQVVEGDEFGYNYNLMADNYDAFAQLRFSYDQIDFYLSSSFSHSDYQRDGLYRNGIYANNSFGESEKVNFNNFGGKGGFVYKITGRHVIAVNGLYMTKAPTLRNTFPNARLNNNVVEGIDSENIYSGDISYIVRTSDLKARLTGFYSHIDNAVETSFFFAEGVLDGTESDANAFIAETVTDISKKQMGVELGVEYQITATLKAVAAVAYGQYTYDNNPNVSVNNDAYAALSQDEQGGVIPNSTNPIINFGEAKLKDYKLPGMPQQAYSLGLEYRDPHYWWIGANGNYLASNYIDVSALLRTDNFLQNPETGYQFPEATEERTRELLKQEQFDGFFLVNLNGGKSWKVGNNTFGFFASINNVFDQIYKTGGFEQSRNANYRQLNQDVSSGTPSFGPKYFYGYGRTYFLNLYFNF